MIRKTFHASKKILLLIISLLIFTGVSNAQCVAAFNFTVQSTNPHLVEFILGGTASISWSQSHQWDFGDGTNDTAANPIHIYSYPDTFNVCLIIHDSTTGCSDTFCLPVRIDSTYLGLPQFNESPPSMNCISPSPVSFFYNIYAIGYLSNDSIKFEIIFGDGTDSVFYKSCNGPPPITGTLTHIYQNPGNYTAFCIMTAPDILADTVYSWPTIIVSSNCGNVSGTVYQDLNNNCLLDTSDQLLPNLSLQIFDGTQFIAWTRSDTDGIYSFNVPAGATYNVQINAADGIFSHQAPSCPSSGIRTINSVPSSGNDFGLICPPAYDLFGYIYGWRYRPGFQTNVCVNVYNRYCASPNGQIELDLDSLLTPLPDTFGIGYTISGNAVTFPISNSDLNWSFCIPVIVSANAQIGDSICITMNLTPIAGDSIPSDNTRYFCFPVKNSWDPNEKHVLPSGVGGTGSIRPNTDLTYTILFQNTGNSEAVNIFILDTLDINLDAASFEVIGSSHPINRTLLAGNILRFNFDNIYLPDSNSNEQMSHGYVTYRIKQLNNVAHLTQIHNSASIYFDFNRPIYTNVTLNTIDHLISVSQISGNSSLINVYPNPCNEQCYLNFDDNRSRTIVIINSFGKVVYRNRINKKSILLNIEKYPSGLYTIREYEDEKQNDYIKLMIAH